MSGDVGASFGSPKFHCLCGDDAVVYKLSTTVCSESACHQLNFRVNLLAKASKWCSKPPVGSFETYETMLAAELLASVHSMSMVADCLQYGYRSADFVACVEIGASVRCLAAERQ